MKRKSLIGLLIGLFVVTCVAYANIAQERAQTPTIINTSLSIANSEVCYTFTFNCHGLEIHSRNGTPILTSFAAGTTSSIYFTISGGSYYSTIQSYFTTGQSICFISPSGGDTVEMMVWR